MPQANFEYDEGETMLPLSYDPKYDITVCINCCIGIPFDWIEGHLKDNHGIRTTARAILEHIAQEVPSLDSTQVVEWLADHLTIPIAIIQVPIIKGFGCSLCLYYSKKRQSIRNHISTKHRGMDATIKEVDIQRPFGGWFKKYIEVREVTEADMIEEEAWKDELNRRFENALRIDSSGGNPETTDMRLMNAFIAKVRYVRL